MGATKKSGVVSAYLASFFLVVLTYHPEESDWIRIQRGLSQSFKNKSYFISFVWFHVKRQGILWTILHLTKQSIGELESNFAPGLGVRISAEKIAMTFQNEHMVTSDQWEDRQSPISQWCTKYQDEYMWLVAIFPSDHLNPDTGQMDN